MGRHNKMKILFICNHNSVRSQMAEGLLRAFYGDWYEAHSAGIEATQVDPRATKVMNEIGIDISGQHSKTMNEYRGILFDVAVTVCDKTREACPICGISLKAPEVVPTAKKTIHKTFRDPSEVEGTEEEQLDVFRQVRDEIKDWISETSQ